MRIQSINNSNAYVYNNKNQNQPAFGDNIYLRYAKDASIDTKRLISTIAADIRASLQGVDGTTVKRRLVGNEYVVTITNPDAKRLGQAFDAMTDSSRILGQASYRVN